MSHSTETLDPKEAAHPSPQSAPTAQHALNARRPEEDPRSARSNASPLPPLLAEEEDDEPGFLGRHWIKLIAAVMVCGAGGFLLLKQPTGPKTTPRKAVEPTMVRVQLPPPPPPPPKVLPPPPPEQKMVEQKAVTADEKPADKPKDEPPKAKDEPPALGTNIRGSGPGDGFGLGSSGNGGRIGGNGSTAGGSRFGWYAGQVQSRLQQALERNPKTRKASFNRLTAKIWVDATGRITRAKVSPSSGDPAIDSAIEQEALVGQQLTEPPPAGMLMPINLRLTARRP